MWLLSNKVRVSESGLLEECCDCHCHLLPGVDDGVEKMEETLSILNIWETQGISDIWLTPHIMEDYPNTPEALKTRFLELMKTYKGTIRLHLAAENMMDGLFFSRLHENYLLPIGETAKKLLVETSYYNPPINMEHIINQIKEHGYTPILAHPERYQYMGIHDYKKWKQAGVQMQLNLPSLVGAYGYEVMKKAETLLNNGIYDYCGTDIHSENAANYFLYSMINKKIIKKVTTQLTQRKKNGDFL